ncbi:AAA family ATPase [Actinoplanes sp. TRM 88003]|uniref:AAA family ATPase n=1 Tax=Paractinoplanes aksuensis TaxID=2939490 RepID=A0ABT1E4E3_9ACTN|nr:AAA family ATPase [Actinoplanes aksuensis]MCO8277973.1 AAA family ATPase [Actinoplanes aksuensis]
MVGKVYIQLVQLLSLSVSNIGGLSDLNLQIPQEQVIAFAGANGTGKSKLLASLLTPWTNSFPAPRDATKESRVEVLFEFNSQELDQLQEFGRQQQWVAGRPPERSTVIITRTSAGSLLRGQDSDFAVVNHCFQNAELLKICPSLNVVYLPAERRFQTPSNTAVDLAQLAPEVAIQRLIDARASSAGPGHLDDQEFESYAKALCVAGFLPSESASISYQAKSQWSKFKESVDSLLFPKQLLPLTAENPSSLRIGLPGGVTHDIGSLSSGERQALIIISRVFRAGEGHSLVAIDEPDAYLHPTLSSRLMQALRPGLEQGGRLVVATHSPSILDGLPTAGIVRLSHESPPTAIESEVQRIDLYREAGFRASSLTQAELLVLTEGDFDATVLPLLIPELASASIQPKGGREQTIKSLGALAEYDLPIIGIVDADVLADAVPDGLSSICHVWQVADIEAALLSDPAFLQAAVDGRLLRAPFDSVDSAQAKLQELLLGMKDQAISEYAQRLLRRNTRIVWPSPRGAGALNRLRQVSSATQRLTAEGIDSAISEAETVWNGLLPAPWSLVRGKWVLGKFVAEATEFKSKDAFINAVAVRKPSLVAIGELAAMVYRVTRRAS